MREPTAGFLIVLHCSILFKCILIIVPYTCGDMILSHRKIKEVCLNNDLDLAKPHYLSLEL